MKCLALVLTLALVFAVPAIAQDATQDGYSPDGPQAIEQTGGDSSPGAGGSGGNGSGGNGSGAAGSAELPFTGVDLVLIAGLGVGLLGVGLGMRRLTGPAGSDPASR